MASSLEVTVTANTSPLQTQFDIANAKTKLLTQAFGALTKASKDLLLSGTVTPELLKASEAMDQARAKSEALRQELQQATGVTKGTGGAFGEFSNLTGLATQALGAFGVALSVGSLVSYGRALFENAEQIGRQAEVLGLSTDAYQAFTKSAADAGVSTDTVNTALERFNRAQGEAEIGSKVQAAAFLELGVSANIPAKDAIPALAQALLGLKDKAEQARLETVLFGRSGEEIQPVLQLWAQGIDALIAKLKESGEIIDQDSIAKIRESEEAWNKFTNRLQATYTPKIAEAADQFRDLGNAILDGLDDLKRWNDEWLRYRGSSEAQINGFGPGGNWTGSVGHFGNEPTPMPDPRMAAEPGEISNLTAIDAKLEERKDLTLEVTAAQRALADAKLVGDTSGINQATEALADLKKQLDAVNKPEGGTSAANAARHVGDEVAQAYVQANTLRIEGEERTNQSLYELGQRSLDQMTQQARDLENQRYQIAVDGLEKRMAADAHDKVAYQKDLADKQVLYQEHMNRLAEIDDQYAQKKHQQEQTDLQDYITTENDKLKAGLSAIDEEYKTHQISITDRQKLELQLTADIEKEVIDRLNAEIAGLTQGTEAYKEAVKERQKLIDEFNAHVQQINQSTETEEMNSFKQMQNAFNQSLEGMLRGQETFRQAMLRFGSQILMDMIMNAAKSVENWVLSETIKTQVTEAGNAQRTASDQAANAASSGGLFQMLKGSVLGHAASAAAATYDDVSQIPYVGWILAPPAAAAAFAAVMAFGGDIPSFAVGAWDLPGDTLAMVHQGEMIVPAGPAAAIRDGVAGGLGGGVTYSPIFNVNAIDAKGVREFLSNPVIARTHAEMINRYLNRNPSMRPSY